MLMISILTKFDNIARPFLLKFPSYIPTFIYSYSRKFFLKQMYSSLPKKSITLPSYVQRQFWGLNFQSNLFNAAGMFKDVWGYELSYRHGAGAFLCGTITPKPRKGNIKMGIKHPFIPLEKSKSAINWMGLPNIGIEIALQRISKIEKRIGCPIGISISAQPEDSEPKSIFELIDALKMIENSQVDFVELNESCPNVNHSNSIEKFGNLANNLVERLEIISKSFLRKRNRNLPVVVKFSNDTNPNQVDELVELLVNLGFDGINFGNTSTNYSELRELIDKDERKNFDFFTKNFGGGVSGLVLKDKSLNLCNKAIQKRNSLPLQREFVVIRTGGIQKWDELQNSNIIGVNLNQWFTGYFENFSKYGHYIYAKMYEKVKV